MSWLLPFITDIALFIIAPLAIWLLFKRAIPVAVLPILIGLLLAAAGWGETLLATPSVLTHTLGFTGVLLLAFTAGLEMRHTPGIKRDTRKVARFGWLIGSAANALLLPFIVGSVAAFIYFNQLPGWSVPGQSAVYSAMAVGLCLAVSALPVLIGIVRELKPEYRHLGRIALKLAVIDDIVLWTGLALLLILASNSTLDSWGITKITAISVLAALPLISSFLTRHTDKLQHLIIIWILAALFLAAGSWASYQLGLHALLGAYFAGITFPAPLIRKLAPEKLGLVALFTLAPLFFGYSGLKIDADALNMTSLLAAIGLLVLATVTKIGAVVLLPPSPDLSRHETFAVGALLQCKGLMEIVAATILHDQGLLSESAYAALVTLAVFSTTLTGPLFRLCFRFKSTFLDTTTPSSPRKH